MVATQSPAPDPGSIWTAILVTAAVAGIAALAYYLLTAG